MKRLLGITLAVLLGLAGTEAVLRLVLTELEVSGYSFPKDMVVPDNRYRRTMVPGFKGVAFHPDGVQFVPLELDQRGYLPASEVGGPGEKSRVVLIGGKSVVFSSGLPLHCTLNAAMARNSSCPILVHNTAWPAFGIYRNFHMYRERLEKEVIPDLAVICLYGEPDSSIPERFDRPPEPGPEFKIPRKEPAPYGYLPAQLIKGWKVAWKFGRGAVVRFSARLGLGAEAAGQDPEGGRGTASGPTDHDKKSRFKGFIEFMQDHFKTLGARSLVVFLPRRYSPPEYYADYQKALPKGLKVLDLHREMAADLDPGGFIWEGHYGREIMEAVGSRLSREVCLILSGRQTAGQGGS